jgi:hypothetical protein
MCFYLDVMSLHLGLLCGMMRFWASGRRTGSAGQAMVEESAWLADAG